MTTHPKTAPQTVTKRFTRHAIAMAIGSSLLLTTPAWANDPTGGLRGTITAGIGADISGATVSIRNEAQGFVRTIEVDANGEFSFKGLPIGSYTITISKPGFSSVKQEHVDITLGGVANYTAQLSENNSAEVIEVVGGMISKIDTISSTNGLNLNRSQIDTLPVGQNTTALSLLAPGAVAGDSDFGNLPSFSGASAAENAYYLNGFNITEMRKGMGWLEFPWEAVKEAQISTGGVSAQYGRFVGGVTNIVTKSGSNEWDGGVSVDYAPASLRSESPDIYGQRYVTRDVVVGYDNQNNPIIETREIPMLDQIVNNSSYEVDTKTYSVFGGGPLITDKLFFYAVLAPTRIDEQRGEDNLLDNNGEVVPSATAYKNEFSRDSALVSVDWNITGEHTLNVTMISSDEDNRRDFYHYTYERGLYDRITGPAGNTEWERERWVRSINYQGQVSDDIHVSASYGKSHDEYTALSSTPTTAPIWDNRTGAWVQLTDFASSRNDINGDERSAFRFDIAWNFSDHTVQFGYDQDEIDSWRDYGYTGPNSSHNPLIEYYGPRLTPLVINTGNGNILTIPAGEAYARLIDRDIHASVSGESKAFYVEDHWDVADGLRLNMGLRNEEFINTNGAGDEYVAVKDQWAPRVGIIWDIDGEGTQKLFFNYGRYFMPVPQNTGVRMAAPEWNVRTYHPIINSVPGTIAELGTAYGAHVIADGTVRDGAVYATRNLDPMYEDEFAIGYERELNDNWVVAARLLYRNLISSIEDAQVDYAVYAWCADNPDVDCSGYHPSTWNGGTARIMNPGQDADVTDDFDGDGDLETYTIPKSYLGYPEMERTYKALELKADGDIGDLNISANYTYSKSEGNTEGLLRSDNDQSDPGWTRSFDSPEMTDYAFGYLPNDRRHNFKLYGSYQLTESWSAGFTWFSTSGRPLNRIGYHNLTSDSCAADGVHPTCDDGYANENFYFNNAPSPRGSWGRTPWINTLNAQLRYTTAIANGNLAVSLNIFNLLDADHATQLEEYGEDELRDNGSNNRRKLHWGEPTSLQAPRSVRLSLRYDF